MYRYIGYGHLSVCVCLSVGLSHTAFLHYCMHPDVTLGNCRECPVVVCYWAGLQLVHRFHCYANMHVQYYRMTMQCKRVSIDVNAI